MKRKKNQILLSPLLFVFFALFLPFTSRAANVNCTIPSHSILLTPSRTVLETGKSYHITQNTTLTGQTLTIEAGAKLYIPTGLVLQAGGTMHMQGGEINICDNAGFFFKGAVNIGKLASQKDAIVNVGNFSFFSVNGSISQLDPADGKINTPGKAQFNLGDGANINVCATLSISSLHYPMVNYVGIGDVNANVVNRAPASGTPGARLSESAFVNWFALAGLAHVSPGRASLCTNATACQEMWPPGLKQEIEGICSETGGNINPKPALTLTKTGKFNETSENEGYASVGETITYTFKVKNTGNVPLRRILITDDRLTDLPTPTYVSGDTNNDGLLDLTETWTYQTTYSLKEEDISRKVVYNIATATGSDFKFNTATATSYDPNPLPLDTPDHPGILADCPKCTIVLLKEYYLLVTNPHIIQLIRNLDN
ncbi:hypothetical protein HX004_15000 [Myroides sp. 1354]|uniref:DUF7507 domain-containing protein n=1 Tax=unclassified Myroides TaxID=2642485 RepID=UPI00257599AC|nr:MULTISPECIES: hypothetical protein [unclassified Myroides]MDM1046110.1 hypothetical protein [Myroides sp. R163-1]MDM1057067.1 hypothetical protein [Myroides sp. 1354]MDM1070241.1 hypothetical protein [Myroides sp. 1372]